MKVLVIGSGGREHALVWKIKQSPLVKKVYAAPGNGGIAQQAECINIGASEIDKLVEFARKEKIDLTVVGPEQPLVNGIVDKFRDAGLKIFGPTKQAAELEGSKAFAKEIMRNNAIPTASAKVFSTPKEARSYIEKAGCPVVIKADGLASGKGVIVCLHPDMAEKAIKEIMEDKAFGTAGAKVVIEEYLEGKELSVIAITDGKTIIVLEPAQDYKRVFDGDKGPNTGGMGSYSPPPFVTPKMMDEVIERVLVPTVHGMKKAGRPYQGALYAGLMLTPSGPKVLEFNARFGDPETQPILMRLKSDLVPILLAAAEEQLDKLEPIEWHKEAAVCVVMTSKGYPMKYQTEFAIQGLEQAAKLDNTFVFHAGTVFKDTKIVTSGGRVLGVTALGKDIPSARARAYQAVKQISFEGAFYRTDIAAKR